MGMINFWNKAIRYGLIAMIALSLFLSWKIWTSPRTAQLDKKSSGTALTLQQKSPSEVFLPTYFVYHKEGKSLYSNKESTISLIQKAVSEMDFSDYQLISSGDEKKYFEMEKMDDSLEMVYPDPFSLHYYLEVFQDEKVEHKQYKTLFDSVHFSFSQNKIYFLCDKNFEIYQLTNSTRLNQIKRILLEEDPPYILTSNQHQWLPHKYYFDEPIELKKYSYILANQSYTTFSQAFFENSEDVYSQNDNNSLRLFNPENETLTINDKTRELTFIGKNYFYEKSQPKNLYRDTFSYISKLGNTLGTLRYFTRLNRSIVYKNYVEGFPVMGEYYRGKIKVSLSNISNVEIKTNLETIQIPIPSDEQVVLPSTLEVMTSIEETGFPMEEIQNVQVGYTWKKNESSAEVVDLSPEWYVRRNDTWLTVADCVASWQKEAAN